jgi:hypothetical protein
MHKIFKVDYYFNKIGQGGNGARTQVQGSTTINLQGASSDFAVQQYLQKKHPGCFINIMSLSWH